ncbi:MAG: RloB family protein [Gammaproteobacteria bacterium]
MARRYISRLRGRDDFRRKSGLRTPRSITLIVCEGETEQLYFQAARLHFGLRNAEVVIADNARDSAPISVVRLAEAKCREPGGYDKVFCVFDRDTHDSFAAARKRVTELQRRAENPLPIADVVSIPCFEVWVLLHFERSDAPFNRCAEVVARIEQKHVAGYRKTDETTARDLMTRLPTALANGVWLAGRAQGINNNPCTAVHMLMR